MIRIFVAPALPLSLLFLLASTPGFAAAPQQTESLEQRLRQQDRAKLIELVEQRGDAARGALLYHNPELTCVRCHEPSTSDESWQRLGPAIAELNNDATTNFLIESLLDPSKEITEGFQSESILTVDGKQITGLIREENSKTNEIVMLDPGQDGKVYRIPVDDVEQRVKNKVSAMPKGLVGALSDEQSFYDLVRYLIEIKKGGKQAALKLRPPASFFAVTPLPAYESKIDHQALINSLDDSSLQNGAAIYQRYCARCHGTEDQEGTMPSALRFAEGKFKNGNDPLSMYNTMTHGYGLMVAQRWMVPKQKYEVIHYIRETFLKQNQAEYFPLSDDYLANLPKGKELGPDPVKKTPWADMDYGNFLINTYEVGNGGTNIAYKGIAVRLDSGPGGVTQGSHWMLYEHDTMRMAAAWSDRETQAERFIDYNGIHFNDRHNVHPQIVGQIHASNDHRPGWANPANDSFDDDPRIIGNDDKRYGPLPKDWLKYRGLYQFGDRVVLNYTVGDTAILESPSMKAVAQHPVFFRNLNIAARDKPLTIKVASVQGLNPVESASQTGPAIFETSNAEASPQARKFDGSQFLVAAKTFDWKNDLTLVARIRTEEDGTILCQTNRGADWVPGGTSLFIRDGRLVFDIGWVGDVTSESSVDDGQWHTVALVWEPDNESVRLYIDGRMDEQGTLSVGKDYDEPQVRIGHTADDFPENSRFTGDISSIIVFDRAFSNDQISALNLEEPADGFVAHWNFSDNRNDNQDNNGLVVDRSASKNHATWVSESATPGTNPQNLWAAVQGIYDYRWEVIEDSLCLRIPAGEKPIQFAIALTSHENANTNAAILTQASSVISDSAKLNLATLTRGGPALYPETLHSKIETMPQTESTAFAVDYLNHPEENPWSCRMRLTGIDFLDERTAFVCAWDGSIWKLTGFADGESLQWRRIANGLFQPLGIRIVDGKLFITCRDQLAVLEDLNNDGNIDFYRAFNSDHQVTEHFHEFAMGLQSDDEGNFYYAKSARHALPALVPHHGTLLKVSKDGASTSILGNGFRAANGVCLNPDGTFFVTDQEGHWTPKNRINWVRGDGGFYGNMMGYHDVQDDSDDAMEQPLCWITNRFDRSPGELLWVPKDQWGSLGGTLLNMSYGMGQVFVVPHETVDLDGRSQLQGGMCSLPIPLFPTGIMRGRFHSDGALYGCGMYAWAGNQQKSGGLYRIRHQGKPAWLPTKIQARNGQISITFSDTLQPSAIELDRYVIQTWDIRRSSNYGSEHYDEKELPIASAEISDDQKTLVLTVPDLETVRSMEIKCSIETPDGRQVERVVHNTIHSLDPVTKN